MSSTGTVLPVILEGESLTTFIEVDGSKFEEAKQKNSHSFEISS